MKSRSFLGSAAILAAFFGDALGGVRTAPYAPGKHSHRHRHRPVKYASRDLSRHTHRDGCKAARKGIAGVPSGIDSGIGVNGIRGAKGGGRDAGGATVTLCKRKQRLARREWWKR